MKRALVGRETHTLCTLLVIININNTNNEQFHNNDQLFIKEPEDRLNGYSCATLNELFQKSLRAQSVPKGHQHTGALSTKFSLPTWSGTTGFCMKSGKGKLCDYKR